MKNIYGKYKLKKKSTLEFKHINMICNNSIIELNEKNCSMVYDVITNEPIMINIDNSIHFKIVETPIYNRTDNYTGEFITSTNSAYGDEVDFFYFYEYFLTIAEHRKNIYNMINNI